MAAVVARLRADVAALMALDLGGIDGGNGPELHRALATTAGQVQAVAARVLAKVEDDGRWARSGWRTFGEWASRKQGASFAAVRRDAALGRALDSDLPATRAAVEAGAVSIEHAQVLARFGPSTPARRAALTSDQPEVNEAHLLAQARQQAPDQFQRTVRRWAATVDAAALETEHETASAREYLSVSRRSDGMVLQGFLTHEHGEAVAMALRAVAGVPASDDVRSREQRQAAALVDASRIVLDRGLAGSGQSVRPHLSVLVPWETLRGEARRAAQRDTDEDEDVTWLPESWRTDEGGPRTVAPARTTGGTFLPRTVLDRLACDSEISRVVFGPDGDVLDVGRAQRTYSGQQRRAVIARDESCRYPGCGAPVTLGEVHHVVSWAHGGRTSVENGVLVCWFHHDLVHRRGLRIARVGGDVHGGRWEFRESDGTLIGADPCAGVGGPSGPEESRSSDPPGTRGRTGRGSGRARAPGPESPPGSAGAHGSAAGGEAAAPSGRPADEPVGQPREDEGRVGERPSRGSLHRHAIEEGAQGALPISA